ncbi:MAG: hypothetical protein ACU83N_16690 [Gammaproteobacteria bacterium]
MKQNRTSTTSEPSEANPRLIVETRKLFQSMVQEARDRDEADRQITKSHGPVARLLLTLTVAAGLLTASTMFYGIYSFPDAPIRQTATGFEGKAGRVRTEQDFKAFKDWEKAMILSFSTTFCFGFAFAVSDRLLQRREDKH